MTKYSKLMGFMYKQSFFLRKSDTDKKKSVESRVATKLNGLVYGQFRPETVCLIYLQVNYFTIGISHSFHNSFAHGWVRVN